jgi:hypothetical protein
MENIANQVGLNEEELPILDYALQDRKPIKGKLKKRLIKASICIGLLLATNEDVQRSVGLNPLVLLSRGFPAWRNTGSFYNNGTYQCYAAGLEITAFKRWTHSSVMYTNDRNNATGTITHSEGYIREDPCGITEGICARYNLVEKKFR